jgi:hypothetical protein
MVWQFGYKPESIFDLRFHPNTPVGPQRCGFEILGKHEGGMQERFFTSFPSRRVGAGSSQIFQGGRDDTVPA